MTNNEKKLTLERLTAMVELFAAMDGKATRIQGLPTITRFYAKVKIDKKTGCWMWQGSINKDGYGQSIWIGRERWIPHRFAYHYAFGKIAAGLEIHHKCENRSCVFPLHLKEVTHEENMSYTRSKFCRSGRHRLDNPANIYRSRNSHSCRSCNLEKTRECRERRKEKEAASSK